MISKHILKLITRCGLYFRAQSTIFIYFKRLNASQCTITLLKGKKQLDFRVKIV